MSLYELAVLGDATDVQRSQLATTVQEMVTDFGLRIDVDVVVHDGGSIGGRDRHAAFAVVYFGGDPNKDLAAVDELIQTSAPIIPTIARGAEFSSQIPSQLHFANGLRRTDDPKMTALAAALLECVGFGCVGELSMADAIFLSASVPDPRRSSRFAETADSVAITAAVTALMYVSLGRRMLVWGGHPAITPMIWVAAESMDVDYATWVKLYQSKFFEDDFPEENARFGNVVFVDTVDNDRGVRRHAP